MFKSSPPFFALPVVCRSFVMAVRGGQLPFNVCIRENGSCGRCLFATPIPFSKEPQHISAKLIGWDPLHCLGAGCRLYPRSSPDLRLGSSLPVCCCLSKHFNHRPQLELNDIADTINGCPIVEKFVLASGPCRSLSK